MRKKGTIKFYCAAGVVLLLMAVWTVGCMPATASSKSDLEKRVDALVQANAELQKRVDELERKMRLLESNLPRTAPVSSGSVSPSPAPTNPPDTSSSPLPSSPGALPPPPGLTVYKLTPPSTPSPGEASPDSPPGAAEPIGGEAPPPLFEDDPDFIEEHPPSFSPAVPPPMPTAPGMSVEAATLYESALGQFQKGETALAIEAFKLYLTKYPDSNYAPNAMFYLGESLYINRKYSQAMENFRRLLMKYPDSEMAPEALFKLGMCFLRLNDVSSAKQAFNRVVQTYPYSDAARSAEAELKKLE